MNELYVNDEGTRLNFNFNIDISSANEIKIKYKKPDGTTGEWTAQIDSNNPNQAYYITQAGDIDMTGIWTLQLYVDLPTWKGHTNSVQILVKPLDV